MAEPDGDGELRALPDDAPPGAAFVVLAAGPGTRMGDGSPVHKALVPLGGRAVLSHLVDRVPRGAELIVCVGDRADQVCDYLALAHPGLDATIVPVPDWDQAGAGPGATLLAARDAVGDRDMIYTSCDTFWDPELVLLDHNHTTSWLGYAPKPAGTPDQRWCLLDVDDGDVIVDVEDKSAMVVRLPANGRRRVAYTGLGLITRTDLPVFWDGLAMAVAERRSVNEARRRALGETQVSAGWPQLVHARDDAGRLRGRRITWTDVGDADAYHRAIIDTEGFDWRKRGQSTWVLHENQRVVTYHTDPVTAVSTYLRGRELAGESGNGVPQLVERRGVFTARRYVNGTPLYEMLDDVDARHARNLLNEVLEWAEPAFWRQLAIDRRTVDAACHRFYRERIAERLRAGLLPDGLAQRALEVYEATPWHLVTRNGVPCPWHGDFNPSHVIRNHDTSTWYGIDWRPDFAGHMWGDRRYDRAKLTAGLAVNWDRVRRGDLTRWRRGYELLDVVAPSEEELRIAALSLLSSATCHPAPLDELLVTTAEAVARVADDVKDARRTT